MTGKSRRVRSEGVGQVGQAIGGNFGVPIPWRLARDGQQVVQGLEGDKVYKIDSDKPKTFLGGFFKGGFIDYLGLRPKGKK